MGRFTLKIRPQIRADGGKLESQSEHFHLNLKKKFRIGAKACLSANAARLMCEVRSNVSLPVDGTEATHFMDATGSSL